MQYLEYPKSYYISSGKGRSEDDMVAFDSALCAAGIANYNLVKVSSILASGIVKVEKIDLREGSLLPTAYARIESNTPGEQIATAVGVALPCNKEKDIGVIMEFSGKCSASYAEEKIRSRCAEAMARHGIEYNEILVSSIDAIVEGNDYISLVSAIAFW